MNEAQINATEEQSADTYHLISTGRTLGGLSKDQVARNLRQKFTIKTAQANAMLVKGSTLKKNIKRDARNKAVRLFASLGLEVEVHEVMTQKVEQASQQSTDQHSTGQHGVKPLKALSLPRRVQILVATLFFTVLALIPKIGVLGGSLLWFLLLSAGVVASISMGWALAPLTAVLLVLFFGTALVLAVALFKQKLPFPSVQKYVLTEPETKALYGIVHKVCAELGVPTPNHIEVNLGSDIKLAPVGGIKDCIRGRYALSLGLPLLGILTKTEFTTLCRYTLSVLQVRTASGLQLYLAKVVEQLNIRRVHLALPLHENLSEKTEKIKSLISAAELKAPFIFNLLDNLFVRYSKCYARIFAGYQTVLHKQQFTILSKEQENFSSAITKLLISKNYVNDLLRFNKLMWQEGYLTEDFVFDEQLEALFQRLDDVYRFFSIGPNYSSESPLFYRELTRNNAITSVLNFDRDAVYSYMANFDEIAENVAQDYYENRHIIDSESVLFSVFSGKRGLSGQFKSKAYIKHVVETYIEDIAALSDFFSQLNIQRILTLDEPKNPELIRLSLQEINDWLREKIIVIRQENENELMVRNDVNRKQLINILSRNKFRNPEGHVQELSRYVYSFNRAAEGRVNPKHELLLSRDFEGELKSVLAKLEVFDQMFFQRLVLGVQLLKGGERSYGAHLLSAAQDFSEHSATISRIGTHLHLVENLSRLHTGVFATDLSKGIEEQRKTLVELVGKLYAKSGSMIVYAAGGEEIFLKEIIDRRVGVSVQNLTQLTVSEISNLASQFKTIYEKTFFLILGRLCNLCVAAELNAGIRPLKVVGRKGHV